MQDIDNLFLQKVSQIYNETRDNILQLINANNGVPLESQKYSMNESHVLSKFTELEQKHKKEMDDHIALTMKMLQMKDEEIKNLQSSPVSEKAPIIGAMYEKQVMDYLKTMLPTCKFTSQAHVAHTCDILIQFPCLAGRNILEKKEIGILVEVKYRSKTNAMVEQEEIDKFEKDMHNKKHGALGGVFFTNAILPDYGAPGQRILFGKVTEAFVGGGLLSDLIVVVLEMYAHISSMILCNQQEISKPSDKIVSGFLKELLESYNANIDFIHKMKSKCSNHQKSQNKITETLLKSFQEAKTVQPHLFPNNTMEILTNHHVRKRQKTEAKTSVVSSINSSSSSSSLTRSQIKINQQSLDCVSKYNKWTSSVVETGIPLCECDIACVMNTSRLGKMYFICHKCKFFCFQTDFHLQKNKSLV
jgi:hypothetical protein